ncbi:MAG TPA: type II secretion system F family protein [Patescibacteria group bacterium]|nr:type II secretion system F family protein [Patescibacteria group bacterium]
MQNYSNLTLKTSEKIGLISNLSTMLTAGIPILEIVNSLLEESKGNSKKILEVLKADLSQGNRVHTSFAKFPRVFDKVTTSILNASEEAGTLDTTLKDLKTNIQKEVEFNDKVKSALIYPMFIFGVFIAVLLFILLFVIPKVAEVFGRLRVTLPLPTRILVVLSKSLTGYPLIVLPALALIIVLIVYVMRTKRARVLDLFFSLPLISQIIKQIDLTRFARSLYLLLYSGLPITDSLQLTEDVVIRRKMAKVIKYSREMVLAGKTLSQGLRASKGYVPLIMIKLIEAGEKTGTLDKSMDDISQYFDYQVSGTLKTLTALLEPVMLVIVGLVVGGMMLSIIAPIYGLVSQIGTR